MSDRKFVSQIHAQRICGGEAKGGMHGWLVGSSGERHRNLVFSIGRAQRTEAGAVTVGFAAKSHLA